MTEIKIVANTLDKPYPPSGYGWFLVAMLTLAYVLSYIDRSILGLLIEPIKSDLNLTDEQIGLIFGPAFAILYATMGIPIGWMVDRARRTWIVSVGLIVWSTATAISGLAASFWQLFFARMTVGIGEASLSPSAMSIIGDSFPPEKRGKPIAVYTAALSMGGGIAYLIGGAVLNWAKSTPSIDVPIVGALAPWQATFFAVGLPGILVGLVFVFLRDPTRREVRPEDVGLSGNSLMDAAKYVKNNFVVIGGVLSLVCVMTIIAYSQAFLPATFTRTWGWAPEKYAYINGVGLLIFGPATVIITGILSDRLSQKGIVDASFRLLILGFLMTVSTSVISMFMPNPELAYAVICVNTMGIGIMSAMGITSLLRIIPPQIRGQIVALYYMVISLAGLFLGPTIVGMLSTRVFGEENIRFAMATLPVVFGLIPLLLIPIIHKRYLFQVRKFS